jgi:hypothetical protein
MRHIWAQRPKRGSEMNQAAQPTGRRYYSPGNRVSSVVGIAAVSALVLSGPRYGDNISEMVVLLVVAVAFVLAARALRAGVELRTGDVIIRNILWTRTLPRRTVTLFEYGHYRTMPWLPIGVARLRDGRIVTISNLSPGLLDGARSTIEDLNRDLPAQSSGGASSPLRGSRRW